MIGSVNQLAEQLKAKGQGQDWLGVIVTWDLAAKNADGDTVTVPVATLQELLAKHNLKLRNLAAIRMHSAITRTLRELVHDGLLEGERVDTSTRNRDRVVYHLMRKVVDSDHDEVTYPTTTRVYHFKGAAVEDELRFEGPDAEVAMGLVARYRTEYLMRDIATQIVLTIIQNVNLCNGIPLRRKGGVYFINQSRMETLNNLAEFLRELGELTGATCEMMTYPVVDNDVSRASMGSAAYKAMLSDLRELRIDLMEMEGETRRDKVRGTTANRYATRVEEVMAKARELTAYSTMQVEEIEKAVADMALRFRRLAKAEQPDQQTDETREERLTDQTQGDAVELEEVAEGAREERLGSEDAEVAWDDEENEGREGRD